MASMTLIFAAVLLAGVAVPGAQAQLGILGLGLAKITGTVHCSIGSPNATTPVFPNALVQLQCGSSVVSATTTDSNGVFGMSLSLVTSLLSALLNDCKLVVNTPLSTCDATIPTGGLLQSPLQLLHGSLLDGILGTIVNIIPSGFSNVKPLR